jgi:protein dithiol oxidoreductase (disulfide-forming)
LNYFSKINLAKIFALLLALISANIALAQPREGYDYVRLKQAQPVSTTADQVEVVEAFSYACGSCANFEPMLQTWKTRAPAQVKLVRLPMAWNAPWEIFARAYFVSEALGVADKTHVAMFDAMFKQNKGYRTLEDIGGFYATYGVKPEDFLKAAKSFAVNSKIARSKQLAPRYEIGGTPTMIVAGKYNVTMDPQKKIGQPEVLKIVDFLVQKELLERKAAQTIALPPAIAAPVKK